MTSANRIAAAITLAFAALPAWADITVGISVSATGPAASLGIPEKNTAALLPTSVAGQKINYVILDDATNPTEANKNARKFVTENNADIIFGSSAVPTALAIAEVASETRTPQIALAPVELADAKKNWVFVVPQHNALMAQALASHMKAAGVKTLGFIGFADGYGEGWAREMTKAAEAAGIKVVASERYNRTDTSVTGQVVKLVAANPDAIMIAGSGTPAALPQTALAERNYKGKIYQSHGAANKEFMRVGGKAVEGAVLPVGPVVVAAQLPETHPSKKVGVDYTRQYEEKYGAGTVSSFGAHMLDAYKLFEAAVPTALKSGQPGTPAFRQALRDAIESGREVVGAHGVFNMSPTNHYGHDDRARVLVRIDKGEWKLLGDAK
ncbi:ABC transporter substrate-binding protein|uniref:ABC transporter substrate-binding protein n=1 Tax=Noviherbaspirillum sp. L7-7A TaxID=2850560 RepID=UPI001C2BFDFB|nr:ABC transporter substrate-binding protein [Noviherbaspirillum sp. L7-7A]MBV0878496.1 ABC transporter substrate-binding protein [Noviherbaspirillum sp. L7-7A]